MMNSLEKIRDIKALINEVYDDRKCQGELTEGARKSWLCFKQYCDDIKQDLERLEEINKVWNDNEPMESVDINDEHLQELYDYINKLEKENEKLKQQRDRLAIDNGELCVKVTDLQKENQELVVNKNAAQILALNLKRENDKLKKVIDWLNQNLNFKIEKHKSCPNCMFVSYKDLQEWLEPSNEIVDLLKEVLEYD